MCNGGLALQNYTVVVLVRGNITFCSETSEIVHEGIPADATSLTIGDIHAGFQYQFRVTVFTYVFSNSSGDSPTFSTPLAGNLVKLEKSILAEVLSSLCCKFCK